MPDNTYPPYSGNSGAMVVPRQLTRWIDVNPQGGNLRRCETTITLPVFSIGDSWNGWSDIVATFNFEATNNFSLRLLYDAPLAPNYVLCISYHIGSTVTRYMLWEADGHTLNYPLYNGEPIKKNFRLEVWNTSQGATSETSTFSFITSVKQNIDYRFGSDAGLATASGVVTDFDNLVTAVDFPAGVPYWTAFNMQGMDSTTPSVWAAVNGGIPDYFETILSGPGTYIAPGGTNIPACLSVQGAVCYIQINNQLNWSLGMLFKASGIGTLFSGRDQSDVEVFKMSIDAGGNVFVNGSPLPVTLSINEIYSFVYSSLTGAYVLVKYTTFDQYSGTLPSSAPFANIILGARYSGDSSVKVSGLATYPGDLTFNQKQTIAFAMINNNKELWANFVRVYPLPLTFPATAVSTTN